MTPFLYGFAATLNLAGGQTVQIDAPNAGDANPYVQDMQINGVPNTSLWLPVSTLLNNATTTLTLDLDSVANPKWGSSVADAPPSWDSATVPDAPSELGTIAGDNLVTLSWAVSSGAVSYNIYRGTSPGGQDATPIATGLTDPTFTDIGLMIDTMYYYFVTGITANGESAASEEVSATPTSGGGSPHGGNRMTLGASSDSFDWSYLAVIAHPKVQSGTASAELYGGLG